MRSRILLFAGALALLSAVCLPEVRAEVEIKRMEYQGWKDAYRLSNGTVDLVIVPQLAGRIMRYGYIGGPNVLWENTTQYGKPIPLGEWSNHGGDKVWPWPQDDWGKVYDKGWPPPPAADQAPHQIQVLGKDTVRITSPVIFPVGVRIVREVRLAPKGTDVFISSTLLQEREGRNYPVAPWTVTQVPATDWVLARLLPEADRFPEGYKPIPNSPFKAVTKLPQGSLKIERNPQKATKLFTEADILASLQKDTLFTVRFTDRTPADNEGKAYQPGDRAQVYAHLDDKAFLDKGMPTYIELEMTAPMTTLKKGETITLSQVWNLQRVPEARRTPEGAAEILKAM
ncbi:MAG: hypothetical protein OHK0029_02820 [Armatimonadaceae bacterium]